MWTLSGLVCSCDSRVVYSLFSYHQKNLGDPGSSRGMFWAKALHEAVFWIWIRIQSYQIGSLLFGYHDLPLSMQKQNRLGLTWFLGTSNGKLETKLGTNGRYCLCNRLTCATVDLRNGWFAQRLVDTDDCSLHNGWLILKMEKNPGVSIAPITTTYMNIM